MLQTYIRAASRGRGAAARTATTVARPQEGAALAAARRSTTTAARASIVHDKLVLTPAQRRRHIFNEALAMTPEARAGDGPHVTFLRALARRLSPAVMLPHGRVHVALDAEPELTPAEELELVGADVGRVGWEYR